MKYFWQKRWHQQEKSKADNVENTDHWLLVACQHSNTFRPCFNQLWKHVYAASNDVKRQVDSRNTGQSVHIHWRNITTTERLSCHLLTCLKPQVGFHQLQTVHYSSQCANTDHVTFKYDPANRPFAYKSNLKLNLPSSTTVTVSTWPTSLCKPTTYQALLLSVDDAIS